MTLPMFNLQFPRLTLVLSSILALAPVNTIQAQEQALQAMANGDAQWEFINQYCTECHNFEDYSGGLDFTTMFVDEIPDNAHVWEKAIQKLRGRIRPCRHPPGR